MKKFVLYSLMLGTLATTVTACRNIEEDGQTIVQNSGSGSTENLILSGKITSNLTLKANNIYKLRGLVYVTNGATLTIEPGTKIVGEADKNGALIITRGSKIMAEGTAANPIILLLKNQVRKEETGQVL
jgi:CO/xanthine dehydrogenase Mo-binding subunit